jgi:hypothetical protein
MYIIYIYCAFLQIRYPRLRKNVSLELTTGMRATLPPTIRMPSIFGELFFW